MFNYRPSAITVGFASSMVLGLSSAAHAVDLTVTSIEVNQAVQYGTTKLFANNITWVRVKVGVAGAAGPVSNVDASLRVSVDGVQLPGPPVFSINGPVSAVLAPNNANINDTINFAVIPPVSSNVTFTVEVNPNHSVVETNFTNNISATSKNFECRKIMEMAYVPINYTFNGAGLPPANFMEPGIGDGFLRAIYHPAEWNYHKSPLPPLNWAQNINISDASLLNTLHDIRINQIPGAGYPQPVLVFGFLPGNPFSGNGEAIGVPGDVAFGNTESVRFQRTLAHEMGHCFGLQHDSNLINTIGVDTERHLKDTQNLAQLFPANKNDVMVAGLLTNQAFVWQNTYNVVHNDSRMQCSALADGPDMVPIVRVSGVVDNLTRNIDFSPVTRIMLGEVTPSDPNGDVTVIAYDAAGNELARVSVRTDSSRELCVERALGAPALLNPSSPLNVSLPETINGQTIAAIKLVDVVSGRIVAQRRRSAHAPVVGITAVAPIGQDKPPGNKPAGAPLTGRIRVEWSATDADGDALSHTLLYSRDGGGSWLPLVVNTTGNSFEFNASDVPSSVGPHGKFRISTTDGLNVGEDDTLEDALAAPNAPQTFLLTPNEGDSFPQHAPVGFHAASWDMEDLMLTGSKITWTSSIDGPIGTGQLFINPNLTPGTHTITVTGTDNDLMSTSKSITLTITPRIIISPDCNNNGVLDSSDIASGTSMDINGNGIPDECENTCVADIMNDGIVNVDDLLAVINAWGACPAPCPPACAADVNANCAVNVDDLLAVINAWGPCP